MDSILDTVKRMLGIDVEDTAFDIDIIVHINTAIVSLLQLGIGPQDGFVIEDSTQTWEDLLGTNKLFSGAKTYIVSKVRILFDPPSSSFILESMNRNCDELLARLSILVVPETIDTGGTTNE